MKKTRHWLKGTRGRVLRLLRTRRRTVNELAAELELTDNAVRSHLANLGTEGLVEQVGTRPGVRKPEAVFGLTEEAEHLFPRAYGALVTRLLEALGSRLPHLDMQGVFTETGHRIASSAMPLTREEFSARLETAMNLLSEMGGLAEIHHRPDRIVIQGHHCPIAAAVEGHPDACVIAQTLLSDILGRPVQEHCDRSGPAPRCAFSIPNGA